MKIKSITGQLIEKTVSILIIKNRKTQHVLITEAAGYPNRSGAILILLLLTIISVLSVLARNTGG